MRKVISADVGLAVVKLILNRVLNLMVTQAQKLVQSEQAQATPRPSLIIILSGTSKLFQPWADQRRLFYV